MTHLRLLAPPVPQMTPEEACLDAFQRELDYIHRTLYRLGAGTSEVDDLAQDLFLALSRAWPNYDATRPLRPYLFGIAFRIVSAHRRKGRREIAFGIVETDDGRPGPDDMLQNKQARALLLAALKQIPEPRRAVLIMRDLDDVPMDEIASVLAIPRFTAYSRLRKARRELEAAVRRMLKKVDSR
ncbi:MAG TPA: RNA polymerase sigma factor [Polyangiales bacterium]